MLLAGKEFTAHKISEKILKRAFYHSDKNGLVMGNGNYAVDQIFFFQKM